MPLSSENIIMKMNESIIMKIQLRRYCRARYLLPLFTYCVQSKSKGKGGRISFLLSLLGLFSFILNMLSRYQQQVPHEFTYGSLTSSTVPGAATLPSGCIFWSKGKDHYVPQGFRTINCNSVCSLLSIELSKIQ